MCCYAGPRNNRLNALRGEILLQPLGELTWGLVISIGLLPFRIVAITAIQAIMMAILTLDYTSAILDRRGSLDLADQIMSGLVGVAAVCLVIVGRKPDFDCGRVRMTRAVVIKTFRLISVNIPW